LEETEKRQLETDLRMTQEVNRSLLTRFDSQTGSWEVGIHYKSSRILSGDYYDVVFNESISTMALSLGDVAGKGLPAALLRTSLQATMRALSAEETLPSKLLEKANRQYSLVAHPGRFATAFYAVANGDHSMVFANGGHLPPLLRKESGQWERLDPTGPVLGLFDSVAFEDSSCTVAPGDILILYSDGVTESRNPAGEFFDEEGIMQAVERFGSMGAQEIAHLLGEELDRFILGPLEDDRTLVIVRRVQ
jgi:sigma-B regulation protein RsbU (phosphoserine phosphatase)